MPWLDAGGGDRIYALDFEDDDRIGPVCWCGGCTEDPCTIRDHEAKAYTSGAAVAFGIIGMAEAVRGFLERRRREANICPRCGRLYSADTRDGSQLCWCSDDEPVDAQGEDNR